MKDLTCEGREGLCRVEIRRARREDIPRVVQINRVALPENYPEFFFYDHLENWPEIFLVAEVEDNVVGYIMCRIETGIGFFHLLPVKKGHVVSIAVLKEYRRRGIGSRLMVESMDAMKRVYNAKEVYLEVRVSNEPAISLYRKLGFQTIRRIPGYYSDGEDAYLMARLL
uniref:N-alpha-acetyltransferase n=1 Tax=Fervidicoccus fontis TaxID=683846 RepID=A0A7J3ZMV0_9CREN